MSKEPNDIFLFFNQLRQDPRLSMNARTLMYTLSTLPRRAYSMEELQAHKVTGKRNLYSVVNELKRTRYLIWERERDPKTKKFISSAYRRAKVFEHEKSHIVKNDNVGSQIAESHIVENDNMGSHIVENDNVGNDNVDSHIVENDNVEKVPLQRLNSDLQNKLSHIVENDNSIYIHTNNNINNSKYVSNTSCKNDNVGSGAMAELKIYTDSARDMIARYKSDYINPEQDAKLCAFYLLDRFQFKFKQLKGVYSRKPTLQSGGLYPADHLHLTECAKYIFNYLQTAGKKPTYQDVVKKFEFTLKHMNTDGKISFAYGHIFHRDYNFYLDRYLNDAEEIYQAQKKKVQHQAIAEDPKQEARRRTAALIKDDALKAFRRAAPDRELELGMYPDATLKLLRRTWVVHKLTGVEIKTGSATAKLKANLLNLKSPDIGYTVGMFKALLSKTTVDDSILQLAVKTLPSDKIKKLKTEVSDQPTTRRQGRVSVMADYVKMLQENPNTYAEAME